MVQGQEAGEPVSKRTMIAKFSPPPSNRRAQYKNALGMMFVAKDRAHFSVFSLFTLPMPRRNWKPVGGASPKGVDTKPSQTCLIRLRQYSDLLAGRMSLCNFRNPQTLAL